MKLSKKSKAALILIMVSSACVSSQAWKSFTKGIEQGIGKAVSDSISSSMSTTTTMDVKNYKSKKPEKLSKETSVQKKAALLDKAEAALLKKDYRTSQKYLDQCYKIPYTEKTPYEDTQALGKWSAEIDKYLMYLNPDRQNPEK